MVDIKVIQGLICPYCGQETRYTDSSVIYGGRSYGMIYWCQPCDAYVGVHKGEPTKALGRLANRDLREWKKKAHDAFDPIWKDGMIKPRKKAYTWLANKLNIPRHLSHIGYMDIPDCKRVVSACNEFILSYKTKTQIQVVSQFEC